MTKEQHSFQAQVEQVLNIVINSMYSHNEIFLRELISNASDACDKLRYTALTHPEWAGSAKDFKIQLLPDKAKGTLTVTDNGIGMDKEDLIHDLGTIAQSGTQEFMSRLTGDKQKDMALIGQFGVGFYSAFMVADKITVISKKIGQDKGYIWESDGKSGFEISPAKDAEQGTKIVLSLKKDFMEYTDPTRLRFVVQQYSNHIDIPIILKTGAQEETVNEASSLWTRPKSKITPEQYLQFYRHIAHAFDEPWDTIHYSAEGVVDYTALLFIPTQAPFDLFQPEQTHGLHLYANRVFISDEIPDLLPHYLRFVKGVIDTNALPLNVSREMLQHTPALAKIKTGLVRRLLKELKEKSKDEAKYKTFWDSCGIVFKEGLYEDHENAEAIADLCRFDTSHGNELTTLEAYVQRMPKKQKNIYFITGDSKEMLQNNPQLEGFTARGIEVLLLSDPIDEFWTQVFTSYKGHPILSIAHPGDDLNDIKNADEKDEKPLDTAAQELLIGKIKSLLREEVADVQPTNRLHKSPVALISNSAQISLHLERMMKLHKQPMPHNDRLLQINPQHPLIKHLADNVAHNKNKEQTEDTIFLLYEQARICEGEGVKDPARFTERLNRLLEKQL